MKFDFKPGHSLLLYIFLYKILDVLYIFYTKVYDVTGKYLAAIGRHVEIDDWLVGKIEKQCGVNIL